MSSINVFRCAALAFLAPAIGQAQGESWTLREGQHPQTVITEDGRKTNLLVYLPKDFEGKTWPLIVFLHGAGQRGDDLKLLMRNGTIPKLVETQADFRFVVASPQIPVTERWNGPHVIAVVDQLIRVLPVDPGRVYLTGVSIGGNGTWDVAAENPQRFAAIAPVSSNGHGGDTCRLKGVPVWAFHNERDKLFAVNGVRSTVNRLRECGGDARLTTYDKDGHNAWTATYANPALYDWLLSRSKNGAPSR